MYGMVEVLTGEFGSPGLVECLFGHISAHFFALYAPLYKRAGRSKSFYKHL